jgi:hypothetical protein
MNKRDNFSSFNKIWLFLVVILISLSACQKRFLSFYEFTAKVQNTTENNDLNKISIDFIPDAESVSSNQYSDNSEGVIESITVSPRSAGSGNEMLMIARFDTPENTSKFLVSLFSLYSTQGLSTKYLDNDFIELADKDLGIYLAKKNNLVFVFSFSKNK